MLSKTAAVFLLITAATAAPAPRNAVARAPLQPHRTTYSVLDVRKAFASRGLPLERSSPPPTSSSAELVPRDLALRDEFSIIVISSRQATDSVRLLLPIRDDHPPRIFRIANVLVEVSVEARSARNVMAAIDLLKR